QETGDQDRYTSRATQEVSLYSNPSLSNVRKEPSMTRQPGTYAIFDTTEGKIVCRLFEKDAPITTKNFTDLAEGKRSWKDNVSGKGGDGPLYSGTIFHRVIPDFMIQGGDPSGT